MKVVFNRAFQVCRHSRSPYASVQHDRNDVLCRVVRPSMARGLQGMKQSLNPFAGE